MSKDTGVVNIHGKDYITVAARVQKFREEHGDKYAITTEIIDRNDQMVVMKSTISARVQQPTAGTEQLLPVATGYAEENRTASQINRSSALEVAETSAIGRALAAFGLAGSEYASADEVAQAITQQQDVSTQSSYTPSPDRPATAKQKAFVMSLLAKKGVSVEDANGYLVETLGVEVPLTEEGASFAIEELKGES